MATAIFTANSASDHVHLRRKGFTYPPQGQIIPDRNSVEMENTTFNGESVVTVTVIRFFISLDPAARILNAWLKFPGPAAFITNANFTLGGEIFPAFQGQADTNHFAQMTTPANTSAFNTPLSSISQIPITSPSVLLPRNGYAPFRIGVVGPINPTGRNRVGGKPTLEILYSLLQQPILLTQPDSIGGDIPVTIEWIHKDAANNPQYSYTVEWSFDGGATWPGSTGPVISSNQYHVFPANFFAPLSRTVTFRVRTASLDAPAIPSPNSTTVSLFLGTSPASPVMTGPSGQIGAAQPIHTWTSSATRTAWQSRVKYRATGAVYVDSGRIAGTDLSWQVPVPLLNNTLWRGEVRVQGTNGVWSPWAGIDYNTVFAPPPSAQVSAAPVAVNGIQAYNEIQIVNPSASGAQDTPIRTEIWRSDNGAPYVLLKASHALNTPYRDYQALSGVLHTYLVRTIGSAGGYSDGNLVQSTISFPGVFLHDADNPGPTLLHFMGYSGEMGDDYNRNVSYVHLDGLAGRRALESEHIEEGLNLAFNVLRTDWPAFEAFIKRGGAKEVRTFDGTGRLGSIPALARVLRVPQAFHYRVSFRVEALDRGLG